MLRTASTYEDIEIDPLPHDIKERYGITPILFFSGECEVLNCSKTATYLFYFNGRFCRIHLQDYLANLISLKEENVKE